MGGFRKFLVFIKLTISENKKCGVFIDEPQGSANRPVGHSQNLGLIHTAVMKMIMIIIQKKLRRSQIRILYIWEFLLQHFWAEMGHRQVVHILKYIKEKRCTTSCLNLIKFPIF
jgi:hypothetical protein